MWRLLRYLFGPDVFISYAHKDADAYADRLTERLKSHRGVSVYLDQEQSTQGQALPKTLERHLDLSRRLVAIITDAAKDSAMRAELERFAKTPRKVIPIDALEQGQRSDWPELKGLVWRREDVVRVRAGDPSDYVVQEILDVVGADRQSRRARRGALIALALIAMAAAASFFLFGFARRQRAIADARALLSRADAVLSKDPSQRDRALLLAIGAVRRLDETEADSTDAVSRLRLMLEESGTLLRRREFRGRTLAAAVSRDGRFAAAAHDGSIELWDTQGSVRILRYSGDAVRDLRFSADGSHLAASSLLSLSIWRTSDGAQVASRVTQFAILDLALSADATYYATWESGGEIRVYHTATGALLRELPHEKSGGGFLAFSRDAALLGAGGYRCRVWKWNAAGTGEPLWTSSSEHSVVAFSDDGTIAIGSGRDAVTARSLIEGRDLWAARGTSYGWYGVSIDVDRIAIVHSDGIEVRNLRDGSDVRSFPAADPEQVMMRNGLIAARLGNGTSIVFPFDGGRQVFIGHDPSADVALRSDGSVLLVTTRDASIWATRPASAPYWLLSNALPNGVGRIAISAARRQLASFEELSEYGRGVWRIYDLRTSRPIVVLQMIGQASAVDFRDGTLVTGNADGEVFVWNGGDFRPLERVLDPDRTRHLAIREVHIDTSGKFAAASTNVELFVWSLDAPQAPQLHLALPKAKTLEDFTFGRSHDELVTLDSDQQLGIWRWTDGKAKQIASKKLSDPRSIAVIGNEFVATGENDAVTLRSLANLSAPPSTRLIHSSAITDIASAGDLIVAAGDDGFLRAWSWTPGKPAREVAQIRVTDLNRQPDAIAVDPLGGLVATTRDRDLEVRTLAAVDVWRAACARMSAARNTPEYRDACAPVQ